MSKTIRKMIGWVSVVAMCAGMVPLHAQASHYATNPNGYGKCANITIDGSFNDWTGDMLIAQGVANDDARIFRGSHEGPVYDTYSLYGAWDDENLYLMWQFVNVTDVVDPAQGYPISDNGKPWNGDIPQIIALSIDANKSGNGQCINGKVIDDNIWGIHINYETPVDTLLYFSSKPGVGKPALFKVNEEGYFDYSTAVDFKEAGISFKYGDGLHSSISSVMGINANGYSGYKPADLTGNTSFNWADMLKLGHSKSQDTMYEMAIPLKSLGITKQYLEANGIGIMHISTFGQSGITSIPYDASMLDKATEPYGPDASTSEEKEDQDIITAPLAEVGNKRDGRHIDFPTVSISPAQTEFEGSTLKLTLGVKNASIATYAIDNGSQVSYTDGQEVTISDIAKGQSIKVTLKATNNEGIETSKVYTYTNIEEPDGPIEPEVPTVKEGELKVFMYKPADWGSNLNVYVYAESGSSVKQIVNWPGVQMKEEGNGLYSYTLDKEWENAQVIFNDGMRQCPATEGLTLDQSRYYKKGAWEPCKVIEDTSMKVWSDVESGTYKDTIDVTLHVKGQGVAAYNIDNGPVMPYQDGTVITIGGEEIAEGETTHLRLVGKGTDLSDVAADYYYTKKENNEAMRSIYIKKPSGWGSNINMYAYDEREGSVKQLAPWPGVPMEYMGYGYYKYILPEIWEYANIIFNDGDKQVPQVTGFVYDGTKPMIYEGGLWDEYMGMIIPMGRTMTFDNNGTNWSSVYAYIYDESEGSVKEVAPWPGVEMYSTEGNQYEYIFNGDWENAKVIFSNGSGAQIPGRNQTGYSLTGNHIYIDGDWNELK